MMPEHENKMGVQRMSSLILTMGLPLMLSLLINSLYNFVDSVFVSRISEDALAALSLAAPVQMLVSALGLGNAVGLNAVISRALGEKNPDKVKRAADGAIFIAVCAWIGICLLCLMFVGPYFVWQSGGNETIAAYGQQYLSVCMLCSLGQMGQWVFDRFVIASGRSHLFLFTLSAASLTNLILDPIFIFGLFGLPRLETLGAALATVIGQTVGMIAGIFINRRWNREIPFSFHLKQDMHCVREILRVGIPSTLVQIVTSFVNILMNSILLAFSTTAVAVCGVCAKIQSLVTVGVHGINNGLIPIVAYNYGARQQARVGQAIRWAMIFSALLYVPCFAILELAPGPILTIFQASEYMLGIGIPAMRILAEAYFLSIPSLVCAAALQGLALGGTSMCLTMARQVVFPVLLALLLRPFGRLELIWWAFVLAELAGIPLSFALWMKAYWKVQTGEIYQTAAPMY